MRGFFIFQDVGVFVRSAVELLNGVLNIGRPLVGTALAVCEWSSSVGGCRRLSVGLCE